MQQFPQNVRQTDDTGAPAPESGHRVNWDDISDNYDQFVMCELEDTASYLDLIGIEPTDTVLDVCCGPGRITMLAAERAKQVTAIDLFPKMLAKAEANVKARGLSNVAFQQVDWNCVLPGQNVAAHDIVIASRNLAMFDIEKLSSLARKKVMIQIFADAPAIPALQGVLFSGCENAEGKTLPTPGRKPKGPQGPQAGQRGPQAGPQGPQGPKPPMPGRAPSAYFNLFAKAYQAGYNPNVRIMPERFRKTFATREEAHDWVCALHPDYAAGNEARVATNADPFIAEKDGGFEFCIATTAAIIWWDVRK